MGMFDKDKEIGNRVDTEFELREDFILWDAEVQAEPVKTSIGDARKTIMQVSRLEDPDLRFEVVTLGKAIAEKADLAQPEDFPCVVQLRKVLSTIAKSKGLTDPDALVLQFVRDWKE